MALGFVLLSGDLYQPLDGLPLASIDSEGTYILISDGTTTTVVETEVQEEQQREHVEKIENRIKKIKKINVRNQHIEIMKVANSIKLLPVRRIAKLRNLPNISR